MSETYQTDFHAWAMEQAALLRAGQLSSADVANIAEEIERIGRMEKRELVDQLAILLLHRLRSHLKDNPSLKAKTDEALAEAYELAVIGAARETGLPESSFPKSSPFRYEQAIDDQFWPD
jgi:hypothetical protein